MPTILADHDVEGQLRLLLVAEYLALAELDRPLDRISLRRGIV